MRQTKKCRAGFSQPHPPTTLLIPGQALCACVQVHASVCACGQLTRQTGAGGGRENKALLREDQGGWGEEECMNGSVLFSVLNA